MNDRAEKLAMAQKIVGSCEDNLPDCSKSVDNNEVKSAHDRDGASNALEKTEERVGNGSQTTNGIESPSKITTPKKRGRPKKTVPLG